MHFICDGTFIEIEEPATFRYNDKLALTVDCIGPEQVWIHIERGPRNHVGTIELSAPDAWYLAKELKKAARMATGTE